MYFWLLITTLFKAIYRFEKQGYGEPVAQLAGL